MSKEQVGAFYAHLEKNRELYEEALSFQHIFQRQEEVMDAFIQMARREGFDFDGSDLAAHIFENGTDVTDQQ